MAIEFAWEIGVFGPTADLSLGSAAYSSFVSVALFFLSEED
jgi:hypothetical protein